MVAMNLQTLLQGRRLDSTGEGTSFYDSTKPLPPDLRDDINIVGVPLTAICNAAYSDPRQRQLFKNIIYVGALSALLGIESEVTDQLIADEFATKPKLIKPNLEALALGRDHALANPRAAGAADPPGRQGR